jgi:hypothetical protein
MEGQNEKLHVHKQEKSYWLTKRDLLLPGMEWVNSSTRHECWNSSAWWVNSRISPEYVQLKCLYLQLNAAGPVHMLLTSPGILMVSMWCLKDPTIGWLRNSGGSKFQVTMVLGRNEYLYASTLVRNNFGYGNKLVAREKVTIYFLWTWK